MRTLLVLLLFCPAIVWAQKLPFKFNAAYKGGYEHNIYNSPQFYIHSKNDTFNKSDLINSNFLHDLDVDLDFRKVIEKHKLRLENNLWVRQNFKFSNANQHSFRSQFKYDYTVNPKLVYANILRFERNDKLGLNVLGDELLKSFSYNEFFIETHIRTYFIKNNTTEIEVYYLIKKYDQSPADEDLTRGEFNVSFNSAQVLNPASKNQHKVKLDAAYRNRKYNKIHNYELLDPDFDGLSDNPFLPRDSDLTYPLRHWRYFSVKMDYLLPFNSKFSIKPYFEFQRRTDRSKGDFTYNEIQPGLRIYYKTNKTDIYLHTNLSNRHYINRLAEQNEPPPYPMLHYIYTRGSLSIDRKISGQFWITGEINYIHRNSNTTNIYKRTRRSYNNNLVLIGLKYELDKSLFQPGSKKNNSGGGSRFK